jgi:hypothetical protein
MRPRRHQAGLLAAIVTIVTLLAPGTAAAEPCGGSADIHDRGGEAVANCPERPRSVEDPTSTAGMADGGGVAPGPACTQERAEDPSAWWISYEVPDSAVPGAEDRVRRPSSPRIYSRFQAPRIG